MSFSSDLKNEIISTSAKSSCCRRAFLQGVLSARGKVCDGDVMLSLESLPMAEYTASLIKEAYGKDANIGSSPRGGRCKYLSFASPAARQYLDMLFSDVSVLFREKCQSCRSLYLRGIFFACGRISDPVKQFCLEFSLENRAKYFLDYFESLGLSFKLASRKSETLLYTKNSSQIEDFFAFAELHSAAFEIMNSKIANEFKNNANRIRNFDTVNISKAVSTAAFQCSLFEKLLEKGLLNSLPEELEATARLRLANPDMSMAQLAIHSTPPISKSGINHRMTKLVKLAEELLGK